MLIILHIFFNFTITKAYEDFSTQSGLEHGFMPSAWVSVLFHYLSSV